MENLHEALRAQLMENVDEKYRTFNEALTPNCGRTIGVRMPVLRRMASALAKEETSWRRYFEESDMLYEERLIRSLLFGYIKDDDALEAEAERVIPTFDNWAVCDTFCQSYKTARRRVESTKRMIVRMASSKEEFLQRTAAVLILSHFLHIEQDWPLDTLLSIDCNGYYAQMGKAWALATAAIDHVPRVLAYLCNCKDDDVFAMTVRKMCESYRVTDEVKQKARQMRLERKEAKTQI